MIGSSALNWSAARIVTTSSRAAVMASEAVDCEPAGLAATSHISRLTITLYECLRMTILLGTVSIIHLSDQGLMPKRSHGSIHLHSGILDQLAVALVIGTDAGQEVLGRGDVGIASAGSAELVGEIALEENRTELAAQPGDDRRRRADGRKQALPVHDLI